MLYEGTGTTDRRWMSADERGSIIAVTNASGAMLSSNGYDEYGIPQSPASASGATNGQNVIYGRFGYTGQAWIPQLKLYYYKARFYSPVPGRFLQPDPIGQADNANLYVYVWNDPVNSTDPLGLCIGGGGHIGPAPDFAIICTHVGMIDSGRGGQSSGHEPGGGKGGSGEKADGGGPGKAQLQCSIVQKAAGSLATMAEHAAESSNLVSDILWVGAGISAAVSLIFPKSIPISAPLAIGSGALAGIADVFSASYRGFSILWTSLRETLGERTATSGLP